MLLVFKRRGTQAAVQGCTTTALCLRAQGGHATGDRTRAGPAPTRIWPGLCRWRAARAMRMAGATPPESVRAPRAPGRAATQVTHTHALHGVAPASCRLRISTAQPRWAAPTRSRAAAPQTPCLLPPVPWRPRPIAVEGRIRAVVRGRARRSGRGPRRAPATRAGPRSGQEAAHAWPPRLAGPPAGEPELGFAPCPPGANAHTPPNVGWAAGTARWPLAPRAEALCRALLGCPRAAVASLPRAAGATAGGRAATGAGTGAAPGDRTCTAPARR